MRRALFSIALLTAGLGACASVPGPAAGLGDACVFSGPFAPSPQVKAKPGEFRTEWHVNGREIPVHYVDSLKLRRPPAGPACGATTG